MVLVMGGEGAGKRAYVKNTLGYADADIAQGVLDEKPVLASLHTLLRHGAEAENPDLLALLLQKEVVICNEVGGGIVPAEAEDRAYREAVGRLCCALAAKATAVVRLYCGLPQVLKGQI